MRSPFRFGEIRPTLKNRSCYQLQANTAGVSVAAFMRLFLSSHVVYGVVGLPRDIARAIYRPYLRRLKPVDHKDVKTPYRKSCPTFSTP